MHLERPLTFRIGNNLVTAFCVKFGKAKGGNVTVIEALIALDQLSAILPYMAWAQALGTEEIFRKGLGWAFGMSRPGRRLIRRF